MNENDLVIVNTWGINSRQKVQYYPQLGFIERIKYHRQQESVDKTIKTFPSLGKYGLWVMMFNATFNNISAISWRRFIGGGKRRTW